MARRSLIKARFSTRRPLPRGWIGPVALALLAYAGAIKNSPLLAWVPLDLTLLFALVVVGSIVISGLSQGAPPLTIALPLGLLATFLLGAFDPQLFGYPLSKVLALFTFTLLSIVAPFFLLRTDDQRRVFVGAFATLALAVAIIIFVRPGVVSASSQVVTLEGTNTISTARMLATGVVIFVLLAMVTAKSTRRPVVFGMLGAALVLSTLSTGSRGPFLAIGVAIFGIIVAAPALKAHRVRSLLASGMVAIIAFFVASVGASDGVSRVLGLLSGGVDNSVRVRVLFLTEAVRKIADTPFGIGWGNFIQLPGMSLYSKGVDRLYPHNVIVEITLEAGWLAGIAFTAFLCASLLRARRAANTPLNTAIFGLLIFAVVNAFTSGDVNDNRSMWMLLSVTWLLPHLPKTALADEFHPALQKGRLLPPEARLYAATAASTRG